MKIRKNNKISHNNTKEDKHKLKSIIEYSSNKNKNNLKRSKNPINGNFRMKDINCFKEMISF